MHAYALLPALAAVALAQSGSTSQQTSVIVPTPVASSAASSATSVLVPTPASSVPASSVAVAGSSSAAGSSSSNAVIVPTPNVNASSTAPKLTLPASLATGITYIPISVSGQATSVQVSVLANTTVIASLPTGISTTTAGGVQASGSAGNGTKTGGAASMKVAGAGILGFGAVLAALL